MCFFHVRNIEGQNPSEHTVGSQEKHFSTSSTKNKSVVVKDPAARWRCENEGL